MASNFQQTTTETPSQTWDGGKLNTTSWETAQEESQQHAGRPDTHKPSTSCWVRRNDGTVEKPSEGTCLLCCPVDVDVEQRSKASQTQSPRGSGLGSTEQEQPADDAGSQMKKWLISYCQKVHAGFCEERSQRRLTETPYAAEIKTLQMQQRLLRGMIMMKDQNLKTLDRTIEERNHMIVDLMGIVQGLKGAVQSLQLDVYRESRTPTRPGQYYA